MCKGKKEKEKERASLIHAMACFSFFQVMLRQTGVQIQLCTDETMYLWLESYLRVCKVIDAMYGSMKFIYF